MKLPGRWIQSDSRPGVGVLVGAEEPVPHVFLLTEARFRQLFEWG